MRSGTGAVIFDWNRSDIRPPETQPAGQVELNDESLRDGLQSPSVRQPTLEERAELLRLMARLGIDAASIGMPATGPEAALFAARLAQHAQDLRLPLDLHCAARTVPEDIIPIAQISQATGRAVGVMAFIGTSPIRIYAEGWTENHLVNTVTAAMQFGRRENLPACIVVEDATRTCPDMLRLIAHVALYEGAQRICLCDTVGHATPRGTRTLVGYVSEEILAGHGFESVPIEWHGHNDRGLGLANALAAIEAGVDRVHGTALGMGERCGNTAMDQLLVNMHLSGDTRDLRALPDYCALAAAACERPIPVDYPVVGADAFRTATGVHAAAVAKAELSGNLRLADRVYSAVPASEVGRSQQIDIGPASGRWNVLHWMHRRGLPADGEVVDDILRLAHRSRRVLTDSELLAMAGARS
ncbi:LeuA family protein [Nonomuraea sp. NPDC049152]|uniref:LeuA family protein n=1 Tax=Nonomuraea sp. NPDC049152 TaxID=3154350 RepID=UPI0033E406CC